MWSPFVCSSLVLLELRDCLFGTVRLYEPVFHELHFHLFVKWRKLTIIDLDTSVPCELLLTLGFDAETENPSDNRDHLRAFRSADWSSILLIIWPAGPLCNGDASILVCTVKWLTADKKGRESLRKRVFEHLFVILLLNCKREIRQTHVGYVNFSVRVSSSLGMAVFMLWDENNCKGQ